MSSAPPAANTIDRDELLRLQALAMSEPQLQNKIIADAKALGVRWCYHTWNSQHSAAGMPDLLLLHDGRAIAAELKREGKSATAAQVAVLHQFGLLAGVEAFLWRPSDYLAGRVAAALLRLVAHGDADGVEMRIEGAS